MSIVNFENVKVTTMTVIVNLNGQVNIDSAFLLLPIKKLDLAKFSRSAKKFKIPWPGKEYAGSVFSAKYTGTTRGIIKTVSNKSFRNSVAIDICTSVKNISAKLVKNKIHMCGPNSEKLAVEAAQHIINHLINIQKELNYISEYKEERDEVIRWLIRETKGDSFIINEETQEIIELEDGEMIRNSVIYDSEKNAKYNFREIPFTWESGDTVNENNIIVNKYGQPYYRSLTKKEKKEGLSQYPIMILGDVVKINRDADNAPCDEKGNKFNKVCRFPLRVIEVTSVKFPDCVLKQTQFPKYINVRIVNFLLNYIQDYAYHHILCDFLENFKEIDHVFYPCLDYLKNNGSLNPLENDIPPLSVGKLNIAMINYSYSLMMNIDRWSLAKLIDGHDEFRASYNNTTDHHVTVTIPYIQDKDEGMNRKFNVISFMCYKSGIITQSGPSPKIMAPAYYKFMNFINSVRDQIRLKDGKPFNIKYTRYSDEQPKLLAVS